MQKFKLLYTSLGALLLLLFTLIYSAGVYAYGLGTEDNSLDTGHEHTLYLTEDGHVFGYGDNGYGQLGVGPGSFSDPEPVNHTDGSRLVDVRSVAAGAYHSVALTNDGTVYTWGNNMAGQLGDGTTNNNDNFTEVQGIDTDITAIAAGDYHTLALDENGDVWAWGDNAFGQVNSSQNYDPDPEIVSGLQGIVSIAAGAEHSVAVNGQGEVFSWGRGEEGQMADGNTTRVNNAPVQANNISDVRFAAAGKHHTIALREDRENLWGWGSNDYGQLGNQNRSEYLAPQQIPDLQGLQDITAHENYTVALEDNGSVRVFGENTAGSWPNAGSSASAAPVLMQNMSNATAVAAGGDRSSETHVQAVDEDGDLWSWEMSTANPSTNQPEFSEITGAHTVFQPSIYPFVQGQEVLFRYEGSAQDVRVTGEFNDWNEIRMNQVSSGVWEIQLTIPPGDYRYGFEVNNNWTVDPFNSSRTTDGSGSTYSQLYVPDYDPASPTVDASAGEATFTYSSYDEHGDLELDAETSQVAVMGDFTDWAEVSMNRRGNHTWELTLPIDPGEHHYRFVVNDAHTSGSSEIRDPLNGNSQDHAITGQTNSIVNVSDETQVEVPVNGVSINRNDPINLQVGETENLLYSIQPSNATNQNVRWRSTDDTVMSVESGTITAQDEGSAAAVVTTADGGYVDTIPVQVSPSEQAVPYPQTGYEDFGEMTNVSPDKEWSIDFSQNVNPSSVHSNNFYVVDERDEEVAVAARVDPQDASNVTIEPLSGFSYDNGATYYLFIEETVENMHGYHMAEAGHMKFTIEP
ncbi:alpha-tubulin suppressor-like RCC1 family protein [Salsuginibacillus halophilus]|uniref:Alpha-tubulin suppressor-like RCC1 family protein n=1 Tax=Salsuginibacillus halophilus TaxID=517424 RepID=A0A2P8HQE2_9BACI|nr:Ig-like domain-containing protein [Salsuginibacillus halophilus]PSL48436.1 alpha-tubulin suppressor-like RCC1 family protein [Salsuginibacillus halophilus]